MFAYLVRRLLLIIPTLFGIMVINFFNIQVAPGGPVEQVIAELPGTATDATARNSGSQLGETGSTTGQSTAGVQVIFRANIEAHVAGIRSSSPISKGNSASTSRWVNVFY